MFSLTIANLDSGFVSRRHRTASLTILCLVPSPSHTDASQAASTTAKESKSKGGTTNKKRHLSERQVKLLDSLGFTWVSTSIRITRWTKNFHLLRAYQAEFGTTSVPARLDTHKYPKLGRWVQRQRAAFRRGVVQVPTAPAAEGTTNGDSPPASAAANAAAAAAAYTSVPYNRITSEQVEKLNSINFDWASPSVVEVRPLFVHFVALQSQQHLLDCRELLRYCLVVGCVQPSRGW